MQTNNEKVLATFLSPEVKYNPYNFVKVAFPWGEKDGRLEKYAGPREWQEEELLNIARHMVNNERLMRQGKTPKIYHLAIASGRGIGKSTLTAWISLWAMSCWHGCSVNITANTESQLKNYTFGEIGKWHKLLSLNRDWFKKTSQYLMPTDWFAKSLAQSASIDSTLYVASGKLWDTANPDSVAGMHNDRGEVVILDEASGIPDEIWRIMYGIFTEPIPLRLFIALGNPRRAQGPFYSAFASPSDTWRTVNIDGRDVEGTDKAVYLQMERDHGANSREVKIEVMGQFPDVGDSQLIGPRAIADAVDRSVLGIGVSADYPRLIGIDVARQGQDSTVLQRRQGYWAERPILIKSVNFMRQADEIFSVMREYDPKVVWIDAGGGYAIIDRLRDLGQTIIPVNFGSVASKKRTFRNKRMEMYEAVKDWLSKGGMLPKHRRLASDLTALRYKFEESKEERKALESKDTMAKWYKHSTDYGDALALTFAYPVDMTPTPRHNQSRQTSRYDVFALPEPSNPRRHQEQSVDQSDLGFLL